MECPHCQTTNPDNAAVCSLCGQFLIQKKSLPAPTLASNEEVTPIVEPGGGNGGLILLIALGIVAAFLGKVVFCAYFFVAAIFVVYRIKNSG